MSRYHYYVIRLLTLLFLANESSFILGFQTVSMARVRFLPSQPERKRFVIATSSSSLLLGRNENEESSSLKGPPHSENEFLLTENSIEVTDETFEYSSRYWVSNILEYKDNRDPMDSNSAFIDDEKGQKPSLASMNEIYKLALQKNLTSMDDVYNLAVRKNLPKKKPISIHSFISSMSAMAALVLLLPSFHPGVDELGFPRLFTYEHASNELLWQSQLVALLQMVSSILGVFRLPKRSPSVRTGGFVLSAMIVTQLSLVVMSSLNGTDVYLFDAFSMQGRILISVINTALLIGSFDSIKEIVGDKEKKGWETVPNYSSRSSAFFAVFPFHILICMTGNAVLPVLCDKESFVANAVPFFSVFPGVQTLGYVAASLGIGLGALLATFQFEKKITSEFASFWNIFAIVFLTFDSMKFMYLMVAFPEKFAHSEYFVSYTPHLQSVWHTNEVLVIGTILALSVGLKNLSSKTTLSSKNKLTSLEAIPLALETPSTTNEASSPVAFNKTPLSALTSDSKKYQDIDDLEERAYQVLTDLERIRKKDRNEQEDVSN